MTYDKQSEIARHVALLGAMGIGFLGTCGLFGLCYLMDYTRPQKPTTVIQRNYAQAQGYDVKLSGNDLGDKIGIGRKGGFRLTVGRMDSSSRFMDNSPYLVATDKDRDGTVDEITTLRVNGEKSIEDIVNTATLSKIEHELLKEIR